MKPNAHAREEEVWRFLFQYISFIKFLDRHELWSNREMREAFRTHFSDRFAQCADLVQEFRCYFADFPRLREAEVASFDGLVIECEVCDILKHIGLNKSPGIDGLPYEAYLRLPHVLVPILTDMINHWFVQGDIPGSITKGMITLLKKGNRYIWEGLIDYRPITL